MTTRTGITRAEGFTLIELTVGMTVLCVVLALLFAALWFAIRSWDAAELRRDRVHSFALVQGVLARQLRQARPLFVPDADGRRVLAFAGDTRRLSYVAPLSQRDSVLYVNTLFLEEGPAGGVLRLRYAPLRPAAGPVHDLPQADDTEAVDLMTEIDTLAIAYFGVPADGAAPAWLPQWQRAHALPERIRIHITAAGMDTRGWPDLVVCPGGGAACLAPTGALRGLRSAHAGGTPHGR
ncbi:MAG: prepilin-type N-terminal cleavage/methylation domain-containing protein [Gammaproteobacteria bacterium]|nr:prepilin-type N-terminal cleavage/methylation domain-containing protein [Gammaproteobacteria bacterium]